MISRKDFSHHSGLNVQMTKYPGPAEVPDFCRYPPVVPTKTEKRIVLLIAILAGFITPFDGSAVNISLPMISTEFHMNAVALSWVSTAYLLASAVFIVPFGKIADIYGRKRIFLIGLGIFTLASFLMTMVPSAEVMIAIRIMQGTGAAMIFGTAVAILTSVFPPKERGGALGIYITAVYLGLSLGPFLGGVMTEYLGWRSIFLVNIPIGILAILLVLWRLKGDWAECHGERFDLTGSVFYGVSLVAIMYGFSVLPTIAGGTLILFGLVSLGFFVWFEMRIPSPVLDMKLFTKSRLFLYSNIAALINYSATFAVTFLLSLYLQFTQSFSPEIAGTILVTQAVVQMLVSPFSGRLSDRVDPRIVASTGMGFTVFGLGFLIFLSQATPVWYIMISLVILGMGAGLFTSPNTNAVMSAVDRKYYGVASGINGTMRLLGQMLSMGIAIMIFSIVIGRVEITPAYYSSFILSLRYAFTLFTILCIFGIFASLARGKRR
jgi:EmrB/QacA subfamily drug resistance transporter